MNKRKPVPWGWIGFFAMLVILALMSALGLMRMTKQTAEEQPAVGNTPLWQVVVNGKVHLLNQADLEAFQASLRKSGATHLIQLQKEMDQHIENAVQHAFEPVYAAIPAYADWYYSLAGEYLRIGHALGGNAVDYMATKLKNLLFEQSGAQARLDGLPEKLQQTAGNALQRTGQAVLAEAAEALLAKQTATETKPGWTLAGELPLDQVVKEVLTPNSELTRRQLLSLGSAAGAGVLVAKGGAAMLVKNIVAKVAGGSGFKAAATLLGKTAAKSALKEAGVLAGAGTGALVCSPGGPLALACGAVAGLATWVGTDALLLSVDEWLHREDFEKEIAETLRGEQQALETSLKRLYASWLKSRLDAFLQRAVPIGQQPADYHPLQALRHHEATHAPRRKTPKKRPPGDENRVLNTSTSRP